MEAFAIIAVVFLILNSIFAVGALVTTILSKQKDIPIETAVDESEPERRVPTRASSLRTSGTLPQVVMFNMMRTSLSGPHVEVDVIEARTLQDSN